jgi:hypothetical protein
MSSNCSTSLLRRVQIFDDDGDVQDAPIDDWVLPMSALNVLLIYYFYKKQLISKIK